MKGRRGSKRDGGLAPGPGAYSSSFNHSRGPSYSIRDKLSSSVHGQNMSGSKKKKKRRKGEPGPGHYKVKSMFDKEETKGYGFGTQTRI